MRGGKPTHGMSKTKTYRAWSSIKQRCGNPKKANYHNYGGRGISVCPRWSRFEDFLRDMGECPPGMSIEREDYDKNYEPGNCKWATVLEQARNRRSNHRITFDGRSQPISVWAEEIGMSEDTLRKRINRGWPLERALVGPTTLLKKAA